MGNGKHTERKAAECGGPTVARLEHHRQRARRTTKDINAGESSGQLEYQRRRAKRMMKAIDHAMDLLGRVTKQYHTTIEENLQLRQATSTATAAVQTACQAIEGSDGTKNDVKLNQCV